MRVRPHAAKRVGFWTVSSTHLDVYKRQGVLRPRPRSVDTGGMTQRPDLQARLARQLQTHQRLFDPQRDPRNRLYLSLIHI